MGCGHTIVSYENKLDGRCIRSLSFRIKNNKCEKVKVLEKIRIFCENLSEKFRSE